MATSSCERPSRSADRRANARRVCLRCAWLGALLLPMALGCKPPTINPGAVRIQARLQPGTPDQYERLELRWSGTWQAPTIVVAGGEYPGRTEADDSLDLDASQTSGLVAFPTAANMRAGLWSFAMLIEGDGETILAEECVAEIFNLRTNLVQFAEGGAGCVCSLGCQPPAS